MMPAEQRFIGFEIGFDRNLQTLTGLEHGRLPDQSPVEGLGMTGF
jgi:hypothetical protein